jgi:hypothetical protein
MKVEKKENNEPTPDLSLLGNYDLTDPTAV